MLKKEREHANLILDRMPLTGEKYTPEIHHAQKAYSQLNKLGLIPTLDTLNEKPEEEFRLQYSPQLGGSWPTMYIGKQNEEGLRLIQLTLTSDIAFDKLVLAWTANKNGDLSLSNAKSTDYQKKKDFENGLNNCITSLTKAIDRGILEQPFKS